MLKKFRGALLGFAIGDALGMPAEGLKLDEVKRVFGKIEDFLDSPLGDLKAGEWTDDTEQMLILAESLLNKRYLDPTDLCKRLLNLKSNRIGWTTRRALEKLKSGVHWFEAGVESDSCGASLRVLPIGLVYSFSLDLVEKYAMISASVTHRGPSAVGAIAYALTVACVFNDFSYEETIDEVVGRVKRYDELLADKISLAYDLVGEDLENVVDRIGNSISIYDCIPLSINMFLSTESFKDCAVKSANVGGDSDSICAMACGLKGCELGVDAIPEDWIVRLKDYENIVEIASRLYDLRLIVELGGEI
ncbi:ADP-ribosylglycohydrolase family protein [Archaeoglobus sp.]